MVEPEENSRLLVHDGNNSSYGGTTDDSADSEADQVANVDALKGEFRSYLAYFIPMTIGIFLAAMDGTIIISSYASIGSELHQLQNTSWIATAYLLTQTSFQPLLGKLSDIFGRKTCLLTCYAIFALGCLFSGIATSMTQLIAARALAGVGGGGMTALVTMIMSDIVPLRVRGTWQAVLNVVYTTGSAIGAPLGGYLTDTIGWRWAFLLQVPLCVVAFGSVSLTLHLPNVDSTSFSERIRRIDFGGAAVLILAIFFLLFGLDHGGNVSWTDQSTLISLSFFIVFATLFMFIEAAVAIEPFVPKRVVANRSLLASYLTNFFGMATALSQAFLISLFFQAVQRKSVTETSVWLIICIFAGLVGSLTGGIVIQRTGKVYPITVTGNFLLFFGALLVYLSSGVLLISPLGLATGLFFTHSGNGCSVTTTLIAIIANAGKADQALATAASYLFRSLGAVVGISVCTSVVQNALRFWLSRRLSGNDAEEIIRRVRESLAYLNQLDPSTKEIVIRSYANAIQVTFLFTVILAALSAISSLFIKEKELSDENSS